MTKALQCPARFAARLESSARGWVAQWKQAGGLAGWRRSSECKPKEWWRLSRIDGGAV